MKEAEHEYEASKQAKKHKIINIVGSMSDVFFSWMWKKLSETGW